MLDVKKGRHTGLPLRNRRGFFAKIIAHRKEGNHKSRPCGIDAAFFAKMIAHRKEGGHKSRPYGIMGVQTVGANLCVRPFPCHFQPIRLAVNAARALQPSPDFAVKE